MLKHQNDFEITFCDRHKSAHVRFLIHDSKHFLKLREFRVIQHFVTSCKWPWMIS